MREEEGEGEEQADSQLSTEADAGLSLTSLTSRPEPLSHPGTPSLLPFKEVLESLERGE